MNINVPIAIAIVLGFSSILFLLGTAFTKLSIVFLILRNALGLQQTPSNHILFALAMIMAVFISMPVLTETAQIVRNQQLSITTIEDLIFAIDISVEPLKQFLTRNTGEIELAMVESVAKKTWAGSSVTASKDNFMILLTSFTISELTRAFEIGFILFLPFVAIDLIVTTILMALGMMMVSPTILSIPFKLLLFVAVGGWAKLFTGLTLGYQ